MRQEGGALGDWSSYMVMCRCTAAARLVNARRVMEPLWNMVQNGFGLL